MYINEKVNRNLRETIYLYLRGFQSDTLTREKGTQRNRPKIQHNESGPLYGGKKQETFNNT